MSYADGESRRFRADLTAGLTVAIVAVPQSMAYAIIAGAPPVFGLYTSIVSCIVGAFFGSSRHLITGPTNATAIVFASTLSIRGGNMDPVEGILLYTFLIGVVKFAFGQRAVVVCADVGDGIELAPDIEQCHPLSSHLDDFSVAGGKLVDFGNLDEVRHAA